MKAKNLFFGALTCLAFAACSNDDEPIVNGGQEEGGKYIAINIVSSNTGTRASYADGTGAETAVNDVLLAFYRGTTCLQVIDASSTLKDSWTTGTTSPQVEKISKAVAYVVPSETGGLPNGLVVILNGSKYNLTETSVKSKTLTQLQAEVAKYDITDDYFLMTNSVWKENSTGVTPISESNFYTTEKEANAAANAVDVYVERVVAKVKVAMDGEFTNEGASYDIYDENGNRTATYIKPYILGYHLSATSDKSYLIKHIDTNWSWDTWEWNDATNKRSYWATMPTGVTPNRYVYSSWDDAPASANQAFYCQENTSNTYTELVVLAELKKVADKNATVSDASDDLGTLVYNAGIYYTEQGFKARIARLLGEMFTWNGVGDWSWTDNIEIVKKKTIVTGQDGEGNDTYLTGEQWEAVVQVKAGTTLDHTAKTTTAATVTDINTFLQGAQYTAWYWQDGKAYYHVKIQHDGPAPTAEVENAKWGVVRNHVYDLTLNSVVGLGTPVYDPEGNDPENPDPEEPIIPDDPEGGESYLSARINVLKWRVLTQDVALGEK